jgi:hypothetical protein
MAIQPLREEAGRPLGELVITPGGGERGANEMPAEIERGIILPLGPGKASGVGLGQALSVPRQLPQPAFEVLAHFLSRRRPAVLGRIEDHDRADVHVRALIGLLEL